MRRFLFVALSLAPTLLFAEEMPIEQALKIAQTYLREQGLAGQTRISSLALEPASIMRRKYYWIAKWSPSVKRDAKTETGLEIAMDGTIARLVIDPKKRNQDVNRPSALDMR